MAGKAGTPKKKPARQAKTADIGGMFEELRSFIDERISGVDRRIADLSDEINATVQMVDFSEANLSRQLGRMHQQITGVVALPAALPQSSGLELEAVVREAESAAHRIMNAAEAIRAAIGKNGADAAITKQIGVIFEACSFQDLTGQRIRRALERLQHIERTLSNMVKQASQDEAAQARLALKGAAELSHRGPALDQDGIDKLLDV
jgi:chemotaxis regulatin CheY-phosphate phosphatase CheZ